MNEIVWKNEEMETLTVCTLPFLLTVRWVRKAYADLLSTIDEPCADWVLPLCFYLGAGVYRACSQVRMSRISRGSKLANTVFQGNTVLFFPNTQLWRHSQIEMNFSSIQKRFKCILKNYIYVSPFAFIYFMANFHLSFQHPW